jgi:transposase InsO family protein
MVALLCFVLAVLVSPFKARSRLEAENAVLRHQLIVLRRKVQGRVPLTNTDRWFFIQLYRWFPSILQVLAVVRPETLVHWHRSGFRRYWRWKSRSRGGRPPIETDLRGLIRRMNKENPLWGAPRIHGELLKLGFEVAQSTVAKYMVRRRGPPSQGWRTFLGNHTPDIAAIDMVVVPTIGFKLLSGIVIMRLDRRRLVWTNVTANPTAEWIARQITEAFPWDQAPCYLLRDRDRSYGTAVRRRLQAMGIRDHPTAPRSPWQNGHVERLIGSIRRECLDHMWSWVKPPCAAPSRRTPATTTRSERTGRCIKTHRMPGRSNSPERSSHVRCSADFTITTCGSRFLAHTGVFGKDNYNRARTHLALDKDAPLGRPAQAFGQIVAIPLLGGLHHQYGRMA